ncbi:MAG TPA: sigma-70 family RNA polymerase sigma factor [Polyangiaceae bacterium]|nr:sigma-70 family RNA polymerase sigma factor [Polyangiaceae bacterium]
MTATTSSPTLTLAPSTASSGHEVTGREDELRLVAQMVSGDARSWREFQRRYDRLIYRCITKVTARFAARVSADDVHEVYATLLLQLLANNMHKLRTFDPERGNRLGSWIGLLAINATYDHLRSLRRESNSQPIQEAEQVRGEGPDPYEECERREQAEVVSKMLGDFSEKDRQFMVLYFGEGLKPEEVAEKMSISVKTVYSKKHKIQSRLGQIMNKYKVAA